VNLPRFNFNKRPQFNYAPKIGLFQVIHGVIGSINASSLVEAVPMAYDFDFEVCVVCLRVADMPTPRMPSVEGRCLHCHAPIWVAKEAPAAPKACLQCLTRAGASAIKRRKSEEHRTLLSTIRRYLEIRRA
jgi:hypothetical protein